MPQRVGLEKRERGELGQLGRPTYELPLLPDCGRPRRALPVGGAARRRRGWRADGWPNGIKNALDIDTVLDDAADHRLLRLRWRRQDDHRGRAGRCGRPNAAGRTVVLTIDPARRLAQSMGLTELDNTPRRCRRRRVRGGELDAMMLDMKRTFDEIVLAHSTPERAEADLRQPLLPGACPRPSPARRSTWRWRSSASCRATGEWDLIVVDTPPTRSALDFLDAPQRLARFLDGRMLRLLLAPAKAGGRAYVKVLGAGFGVVHPACSPRSSVRRCCRTSASSSRRWRRCSAASAQRAEETYRLLAAPGTAFVVVAAPEPDALREASLLRRPAGPDEHAARRAGAQPGDTAARAGVAVGGARTRRCRGAGRTAAITDLAAARAAPACRAGGSMAARERRLAERFTRAHPEVAVGRGRSARPATCTTWTGLRPDRWRTGRRCSAEAELTSSVSGTVSRSVGARERPRAAPARR